MGSSRPLRRSGMGAITVWSRLRLWVTPCELLGGAVISIVPNAYKYTSRLFVLAYLLNVLRETSYLLNLSLQSYATDKLHWVD